MNKEQEVRPCPFCGSPAEYEQDPFDADKDTPVVQTVGCKNEDCIGYMPRKFFATKRDARAAWNRRDEQAEVVGWRPASEKPVAISVIARFMDDELGDWVYSVFDPPFYRLGEYTEWLPLSALSGNLYASPPAVAKGGVTEALTWYGERATSLASRLNGQSLDAMSRADLTYITAIITELALDAGRRAATVLTDGP